MSVCTANLAVECPAIVPDYRYCAADMLGRQLAQAPIDWLTEREQTEMRRWRDPTRRQAWLRGRWMMKHLIIARLRNHTIRDIEILVGEERRSPQAHCRGESQNWPLSISHTESGVLAAISWRAETAVGVDLAPLHPLPRGFCRLWFSAAEQQWIGAQAGPLAINGLWTVKEALYKASNQGEPFNPRAIEALPGNYRYRGRLLPNCAVITWTVDEHVATLAVVPVTDINSEVQS
jgi:phosphopantetheinyl transferase